MVFQSLGMKAVMRRYGNILTLMDATYQTSIYALSLFMIAAPTNAGYQPIGVFITETENSRIIQEGLEVLKKENPTWDPTNIMTDKDEREISAYETVFPSEKT